MDIKQFNSQNKYTGRNGLIPILIVCHTTDGSFDGAVSWLCNEKSSASSHFVVAKDGRVAQLVPIEDSSWCNGTNANINDKRFYGNSSLKSVKERKTNANYFTISIEHEGFAKDCGELTKEQFDSTVKLIKHINAEVNRIYKTNIPFDREHIVGHYEINPITKPNCPGNKFPFDDIIKKLNCLEEYNSLEKNYIVSKAEFKINGKKYFLNRILIDGFNYIKIADMRQAGFKVDYDDEKKIPIIETNI